MFVVCLVSTFVLLASCGSFCFVRASFSVFLYPLLFLRGLFGLCFCCLGACFFASTSTSSLIFKKAFRVTSSLLLIGLNGNSLVKLSSFDFEKQNEKVFDEEVADLSWTLMKPENN